MSSEKEAVKEFWEEASCGERLYLPELTREGYEQQSLSRYLLEPYILTFAEFEKQTGKRVLEIGVGLGADHQKFAENGALLTGIDLTDRALEHARRRFKIFGLTSALQTGDAERLPFPDNSFDVVYSWGVIHHSPNTPAAVDEIFRVLKPGGKCKIMIYHRYAMIGYMLWIRYALLRLRPFTSLARIYSNYLESPGTKAYSVAEAREMFKSFGLLDISLQLTHGDLLESEAGQRHRGIALKVARWIWPRWFIRRCLKNHGLYMLIRGQKPGAAGAS